MFHITVWKSPDLTVIISLLSLPASPSSSLHLWPSLPLLFHPFILLCVFYPALRVLSDFFFPPPLQKPCLKPDIVCQAPSDSLQSGGPSAPHQALILHISCQTLTSPMWDSSPPSFFSLPFPISAPLFLSIFYSLSFFLPLLTSRFFLVSWTCSVPSLHRWLNVIRQAYSPSNSMCATIIPHPV